MKLNSTPINLDSSAIIIGGVNCSTCKIIYPKFKSMFVENFPRIDLYHFNLEELSSPEIATLKITMIPTLIIFFEGREFYRFERTFGIIEVREKMKRVYHLKHD